jgi:hypothetical protein
MRFSPNPKIMYIIFCSLFFILTIIFVFVVFMFGKLTKVFFYSKHDNFFASAFFLFSFLIFKFSKLFKACYNLLCCSCYDLGPKVETLNLIIFLIIF